MYKQYVELITGTFLNKNIIDREYILSRNYTFKPNKYNLRYPLLQDITSEPTEYVVIPSYPLTTKPSLPLSLSLPYNYDKQNIIICISISLTVILILLVYYCYKFKIYNKCRNKYIKYKLKSRIKANIDDFKDFGIYPVTYEIDV